jgi:hypothetical protein
MAYRPRVTEAGPIPAQIDIALDRQHVALRW